MQDNSQWIRMEESHHQVVLMLLQHVRVLWEMTNSS